MKDNADEFGIGSKNQILRVGGTPYFGSNYSISLDRILHRSTKNAPSPVGTNALEARLRKDPRTRVLLKEGQQTGRGYKNRIVIRKWKKIKRKY
jgi:hypothetical protein